MEAVLKKKSNTDFTLLSLAHANQIPDLRYSEFENGYILSNDYCDFAYLNRKSMVDFFSNACKEQPFPVRSESDKVAIYRNLNACNCHSATLHIFVIGLDCPLKCVYCQVDAGVERRLSIMNNSTAEKAVMLALGSPSDYLQVEFQGGEPLTNFSTLEYIVELFLQKAKQCGKQVCFSLVTSLFGMTNDKLKFLVNHDISLALSFDGPEFVHNANRPATNGNNFKNFQFWHNEIRHTELIKETGFLLTATRLSLKYCKEIVEAYIDFGADSIVFRPLAFLGRAKNNWEQIGYAPAEFGVAYLSVLNMLIDYSLRKKVHLIEKQAAFFSKKICRKAQTNHTEFRSPCGAGIGQIVYDWDGAVYPCDEARMVAVSGDTTFKLGNVSTHSYQTCLSNKAIEAMCISSCMQSNSPCSDCVFMPLCGLCPVYNYSTYNSLNVSNERLDYLCNIKKETFQAYFSILFSDNFEKSLQLKEWGNV